MAHVTGETEVAKVTILKSKWSILSIDIRA
jgi:hypothetical protein